MNLDPHHDLTQELHLYPQEQNQKLDLGADLNHDSKLVLKTETNSRPKQVSVKDLEHTEVHQLASEVDKRLAKERPARVKDRNWRQAV